MRAIADKLRGQWERSLSRRMLVEMWATDRWLAVGYVCLALLTAGLAVGLVLVVGRLVGDLSGAQGGLSGREIGLLVGLGVIAVLQPVVAGLQRVVTPTLGRRVEGRERERVMALAMAPATIAHLADHEVLEDISSATTVGTARMGPSTAVEASVAVFTSGLTGLGMVVLLATFRWWLALLLGAAWLNARHHRRRDSLENWRVMGVQSPVARRQTYFREFGTMPGPAKEIRLFALRAWLLGNFDSYWDRAMRHAWGLRHSRRPSLVVALVGIVVANGVAGGIIARGYTNGTIGLGELTFLLQALLGCAAIADYGPMTVNEVMFAFGAATVTTVDKLQAALAGRRRATPPREEGLGKERGFRLEGLEFSYPGGPPVLQGVDLTIADGESLAIVGENGAGKTTLVHLLCGLLEPTGGAVRSETSGSGAPAVVFQDFARLPMTVRENIASAVMSSGTGGETADVAAATLAAAEVAGVAEFVDRLPDGWDTFLGAEFRGGVDLSDGQWQRVALARALCASRFGDGLLILDEPTAKLDIRAEAAFYDNFFRLTEGRTTVVISHRFATVRQADRIAVLEGGVIRELGSHEELVAREGTYARLFALQASAFEQEVGRDVVA